MKNKRVLVVCEESQAVTQAFRNLGFEAYSNDVQECSGTLPQYHLQMDCFKAIKEIKPKILIGFPPCTYLSAAGLHYCNIGLHGKRAALRILQRDKAVQFFLKLWLQPIKYICLENPTGHISSTILQPTQIIHPYYFGDNEMKRTCLWLKNLPPLTYTKQPNLFEIDNIMLPKPKPILTYLRRKDNKPKNIYFTNDIYSNGNKLKTAKEKSKTFPGIAKAMAEQWSVYL